MRSLGLLLIWMGVFLVMSVLMYRISKGAWSVDALDNPLPVGPWTKRAAYAGLALAASGIALTVWSFAVGMD